ncbi:MAG TPA: hypothetical protein VGM08_04110 [Candidatus Saccharimonadales bacterium]|jgi:hypothetical protein
MSNTVISNEATVSSVLQVLGSNEAMPLLPVNDDGTVVEIHMSDSTADAPAYAPGPAFAAARETPEQEQGIVGRLRTKIGGAALTAYGVVSGAGMGGKNTHYKADMFRAGVVVYSAVATGAALWAQAKGIPVSAIPGLELIQYLGGGHGHAAAVHNVLADGMPAPAGSNGTPATHIQLVDAYKPADAARVPDIAPTAHAAPTASVAPSHAVPVTTQAPATPAAASMSVHELKPGTIERQWAHGTGPNGPNGDMHFVTDPKTGKMTIELSDPVKGTVLPDGKHLTAAQLHDAKVLVTVDETGKGGKVTDHVIEVAAPDGKLAVDGDVAQLVKAGGYKDLEMVIPGTGKGSGTHVIDLSTMVGADHQLKAADAKTLMNHLTQAQPVAAAQPAAPIVGAKPSTDEYALKLASTKPGTVTATVNSPSILTPQDRHNLTTSFHVVAIPPIALPTAPDAHAAHFWNALEPVYEKNDASLQKVLATEGLKAEIINAKGQSLHMENVRELATALTQKGDKLVAVPAGTKLSLHNLVAPSGWTLGMNAKHTALTFTAPHAGKPITVEVPAAAINKDGSMNFSKLTDPKGPIVAAFTKAGYQVGFSDGRITSITHTAATGQGSATPEAKPTAKPSATATPTSSTPAAHGHETAGGGIDPTGVWDLALETGGGVALIGGVAAAAIVRARRRGSHRSMPVSSSAGAPSTRP